MNLFNFLLMMVFLMWFVLACNDSQQFVTGGDDDDDNTNLNDDDDDDDDDNDNDNDNNDNNNDDNNDNNDINDTDEEDTGENDTDDTAECIDNDNDWWCDGFDCDDNDPNVNPDQTENTNNGIDDDCDGQTDEINEDDSDTVCDGMETGIEMIPTRVMILADSSSSMFESVGGGGPKWEQARDAMIAVLDQWADDPRIHFGVDFFPDMGQNCAVDSPVIVDTSAQGAALGRDYFENQYQIQDGHSTPLCFGVRNFNETETPGYSPNFTDPNTGGAQYLIVISDGHNVCIDFDDEPVDPLQDCDDGCFPGDTNCWPKYLGIGLVDHGIKVITINFGNFDTGGGFPDTLDVLIDNGGSGLTEPIIAADGAALQQAIEELASDVFSCSIELTDIDSDAVDFDRVNVYYTKPNGDKVVIGYDAGCANGNGWDWEGNDHQVITLCPDACAKLEGDEFDGIAVEFGCETIIL